MVGNATPYHTHKVGHTIGETELWEYSKEFQPGQMTGRPLLRHRNGADELDGSAHDPERPHGKKHESKPQAVRGRSRHMKEAEGHNCLSECSGVPQPYQPGGAGGVPAH